MAGNDFVIGLGDTLAVNVWKDPDSSAPEVVVRPDGKITLPLIKDMQAAGLTTWQLEQKIKEKLLAEDYFKEPLTVTVGITKIESRKVYIVGFVARPGDFPLLAPMTVLELIAKAEGCF